MGTRLATKDVDANGPSFPAGTAFIISWAAANVDPDAFDDPLRVDLDRSPNRHIGFAGRRTAGEVESPHADSHCSI